MIPGRRADEVLDDLALDLDEHRNVLGILPRQVGQQALEVEVHVALAGSGLQHVLIGHDELVQTLHHLMEDVRGDETIAQRSSWIPGSYVLTLSERHNPFFKAIEKEG